MLYKGVEAKFIKGVGASGVGHAWNQVKIGNHWFNTDLTWDRDRVVELDDVPKDVLKTDKEFEVHNKYSIERTTTEMPCETNIESLMTTTKEQDNAKISEAIEKLAILNEIRKIEIAQTVNKINGIDKANDKQLHKTDEFSK